MIMGRTRTKSTAVPSLFLRRFDLCPWIQLESHDRLERSRPTQSRDQPTAPHRDPPLDPPTMTQARGIPGGDPGSYTGAPTPQASHVLDRPKNATVLTVSLSMPAEHPRDAQHEPVAVLVSSLPVSALPAVLEKILGNGNRGGAMAASPFTIYEPLFIEALAAQWTDQGADLLLPPLLQATACAPDDRRRRRRGAARDHLELQCQRCRRSGWASGAFNSHV